MNYTPKVQTPVMEAECEIEHLRAELTRLRNLLKLVRDAGRPHSHLCGCEWCNVHLAVVKELSL